MTAHSFLSIIAALCKLKMAASTNNSQYAPVAGLTYPRRQRGEHMTRKVSLLPLLVLLTACGQPLAPPAPPASGPISGPDPYRVAAAAGAAVYAVDPDASLLTVTVRRAGLMARFGHDHVVASHALAGFAAPGLGRADVSFRADQLTVDEPQLRRVAGLDTQPSPQAVEGTRNNMLGPVLDAQRYPVVLLHAERSADGPLRVAVTLHGVTRWLDVPAAVQVEPGQVVADGTARLQQTDFGITPFSVGGGLLSVDNELLVRYHIVARRQIAPAARGGGA
jgi:polyisoprenoid-binding protein YceI